MRIRTAGVVAALALALVAAGCGGNEPASQPDRPQGLRPS